MAHRPGDPGPDPAAHAGSAPVVVAVGTDPIDAALEYAVAEARRHHCGVHLVHAVHLRPAGPELMLVDYSAGEEVAAQTLHAAVERAEDLLEGAGPLTHALAMGPVVPTVLEAAEHAREIVLQRRDLSRVARTVTRSISSGVAAHAHVPVVSVPSGWSERESAAEPGGRVTVGVDVPERSGPVIAVGAAAARSRGARLHVLHTWWFPSVYDDIIMGRVETQAWADHAREEIRAELADLAEAVAGLDVEVDARHAHPADALLDAAAGSVLLVVGRHDPMVPVGSHLGPVARAVLREAPCPVLLACPTRRHRLPGRHVADAVEAAAGSSPGEPAGQAP